MKKSGWTAVAACFFVLVSYSGSAAGEHPSEHPAGEHSSVTTATIAEAITKYVKKESGKDGWFSIKDDATGGKLELKLEKIHMERLSAVKKGRYFACVDFTEKGGKTYDVDFFLEEGWKKLKVVETMVHKVDGKPRYTWEEKRGGLWVRNPVK